jgi:signal transduction histidine kinase
VREDQPILLSTLPPSRGHERLALLAALLVLAVFLFTVPFADVQLGRIDVYSIVFSTVILLNSVITSTLLFAQFAVVRSAALLALAIGYLLTGLLMIPYALTFPGAFSPSGWLGAGPQTTVWLSLVWHVGFPTAAIAYTLLNHDRPARRDAHGSARVAILASIGGVLCAVVGFTWLATVHHDVLPAIMRDAAHANPIWNYVIAGVLLPCVVALALLWPRRRSLLDLWLLVVLWAWLLEVILLTLIKSRFTVSWYVTPSLRIAASTFVLLVLLWETTWMYARLALSVVAQRSEREGRLMAMDAVAASIAHEINQPLAAIVTNSSAGLRWLERSPPNLDEARAALRRIENNGLRAGSVIEATRAIFKQSGQAAGPLNIDAVIREALELMEGKLHERQVVLRLELATSLPPVLGRRGQLQQLFVNIATNAAEAMDPVTERPRLLSIRTCQAEPASVLVTIEDSGVGIDAEGAGRMFDAFYTMKPNGMGMGLALCRSIVESHGGRLWASPGTPHGAVFHISLPAVTVGE